MKRLSYNFWAVFLPALVLMACGQTVPAQITTNVVMASGALQKCLGIVPNSGKMARSNPATDSNCLQLPGAAIYNQAGAKFQAGDHAGAAQILMAAAKAGNPLAQLRLAIMYEGADGVPHDKKSALMWYSAAAAQGEPASQMELGGYYEAADLVPENWDLAAKLYQASAVQGWMKGQFAFGRAYQFGIGVPQNRQQAIAWYEKAAAQGNRAGAYWAQWLSSPTNNIGFRDDAEHNAVIGGKLRFALLGGDPAGVLFHNSAQRNAWLAGQTKQLNVSEATAFWNMNKSQYDACTRSGAGGCVSPGPKPGQ
jgi:TPR repeat protein